jgi:hypothetical protein
LRGQLLGRKKGQREQSGEKNTDNKNASGQNAKGNHAEIVYHRSCRAEF